MRLCGQGWPRGASSAVWGPPCPAGAGSWAARPSWDPGARRPGRVEISSEIARLLPPARRVRTGSQVPTPFQRHAVPRRGNSLARELRSVQTLPPASCQLSLGLTAFTERPCIPEKGQALVFQSVGLPSLPHLPTPRAMLSRCLYKLPLADTGSGKELCQEDLEFGAFWKHVRDPG